MTLKSLLNYQFSSVYLIYAFFVAIFFGLHVVAMGQTKFSGGNFAYMDEKTNNAISLIRFIDTNGWIPLGYFILTLTAIIFLQIRQKKLHLYCTMVLILIPCIYYSSFCFHICGKFFF